MKFIIIGPAEIKPTFGSNRTDTVHAFMRKYINEETYINKYVQIYRA